LTKHWFIAYLTSHYSSGKKSGLDLGSGKRNWQEFFKCKIVGLDLPTKLKNEKAQRPDICGNAICLPFKDNSFDFLSCYSVISFVNPIDTALDEIYRVLQPKGIGVITFVNSRGMAQHKETNWINRLNTRLLEQKLDAHGLKSIRHKNLKSFFYSSYFNLTSVYGFSIFQSKKKVS
jgi:ubiquinone/menaquinone biosynthesis C-methylase UbiE